MPASSSITWYSSEKVLLDDELRPASIKIVDGKISQIAEYDPALGKDFGKLALLPGLVDTHVHLNEPGRTEWEGFETGTKSAALGGFTMLVDMPLNSSPVTTDVESLRLKRKATSGKLSTDVGFYAGLVEGNAGNLPDLLDQNVLGVKAFLCHSGIDEFPAATESDLRQAMPLLAERNVPLLAHAEIVSPVEMPADMTRYENYLATRPPRFEQDAIKLLIDLCRETGCPTHIVHLADADCLPMIAEARQEGLPLTMETCPHYLTFCAEEIPDKATQYKCAPPIRNRDHQERLWQGLKEGLIDFIVTDHSPCPSDMKKLEEGRFDLAWGGISSLQVSFPVMWTEAQKRGIGLPQLVSWMSQKPAELIGKKTDLCVDNAANFFVFDPDHKSLIVGDELSHRHKVTPYEGYETAGKVVGTYLRGELIDQPRGKCL